MSGFWDVARTQEEIKKYMLDEIDLESKAPLAYYKFNDGVAGADNTNKPGLQTVRHTSIMVY